MNERPHIERYSAEAEGVLLKDAWTRYSPWTRMPIANA